MKPIDGSLIIFSQKTTIRKSWNLKVESLKLIFKVLDSWWPIQNKWLQMFVQNMRKTNTEKNSKYLGFIVFGNLSFVTKINKIFLWRKNPSENWCQKYDLKQTQQPSCTTWTTSLILQSFWSFENTVQNHLQIHPQQMYMLHYMHSNPSTRFQLWYEFLQPIPSPDNWVCSDIPILSSAEESDHVWKQQGEQWNFLTPALVGLTLQCVFTSPYN